MTKTESINNAGTEMGAKVIREYETTTGRLLKVTTDNNDSNANNDPYVRYDYPDSGNIVKTYTTITDANTNGVVDSGDEAYSAVYTDGLGRTIRSFSDLPNAPEGIYSTTAIEYDVMGRVSRQSVPTETDQYLQPAGDDDRGVDGQNNPLWLWVSYQYDWKGRVTQTTNTDGTTTSASYEGCGCAGGEVVTVLGEILDTGTGQRRKQKIYQDWLGRTKKSETYEWNSSTIYSTTVTTFDSLDRATLVRQYSGSDTSSTYQDTTFEYDGHGRLWKQHRPEQFTVVESTPTPTYTTFAYNADDTTLSVTDGRGASATYEYNDRKQVVEITYNAPSESEIIIPDPTTFTYDAVGNRTSMEDNAGNTTYSYDTLSRLTSETRELNDIVNESYTFNYSYNWSGQLKSMTDPSNRVTSYSFDKIGRTQTVTGSGTGSQSSYISAINYRAWGAKKDATYGNDVEQSYQYNNRLQLSQYDMTYLYGTMTWDYEYNADGKPKHVEDSNNSLFNRLYKYDHVGRLKEAYSGQEADGETPGEEDPDPFRLILSYDVWNNTTNSTGKVWSQPVYANGLYTNNRHQDWAYDANGNVLQDSFSHTINAAGQKIKSQALILIGTGSTQLPFSIPLEIEQKYDGDGQPSERKQINRKYVYDGYEPVSISETWEKRYYLRSSVLGAVVLELKKVPDYPTTPISVEEKYVYANGERIYKTDKYELGTANTGSWLQILPSTSTPIATRQERTPLGGELPTEEPVEIVPYQNQPSWREPDQPLYIEGGDPFDLSGGCTLYGMPTSCSYLAFSASPDRASNGSPGSGAYGHDAFHFGTNPRSNPGGTTSGNGTVIWIPGTEDIWDGLGTLYYGREGFWATIGGQTQTGQLQLSENERNFQAAVTATRDILSQNPENNPCAELFGGSGIYALNAIENNVTAQRQTTTNNGRTKVTNRAFRAITGDNNTGIIMNVASSSTYKPGQEPLTSTDKDGSPIYAAVAPDSVTINTNGPFVMSVGTPRIGPYSGGTLQSRVLQLLHEIGHLVITRTTQGIWVVRNNNQTQYHPVVRTTRLLPEDDGNTNLSRTNTNAVLAACENQINALNR